MKLAEMIAGRIAEMRAEKGVVEVTLDNCNSQVRKAIESAGARYVGGSRDSWGIEHDRYEVPAVWADRDEIIAAHHAGLFDLNAEDGIVLFMPGIASVPAVVHAPVDGKQIAYIGIKERLPFAVVEHGTPSDLYTYICELSMCAAEAVAG